MRRYWHILSIAVAVAAVLIYLNLNPHQPGQPTGTGGVSSDHDEYPVYGFFGLALVVSLMGYVWMRWRLKRVTPDPRRSQTDDPDPSAREE
jgi:H+/Cl- antiporter ClcA